MLSWARTKASETLSSTRPGFFLFSLGQQINAKRRNEDL